MLTRDFYHFHLDLISRGKRMTGDRIAYIVGEKLNDKYYGLTHDWSSRTDVLYAAVGLHKHAPSRFNDLETLVYEIEMAEGRVDSRTAREVIVSLFNNYGVSKAQAFTLDDYIALLRELVIDAFLRRGICAVIAIHEGHNAVDPSKNNPHAHIVITDRPVNKDGFCEEKNREWNDRHLVTNWRELWETIQNKAFERKQLPIRVSAKGYIMLGIDKKPTKHIGAPTRALELRGIQTDRSNEQREINERNQEREQLQKKERAQERDRERARTR